VEYLKNMYIPYIVSVAISIIVLFIVLHKDIPKKVDINLLKNADSVIKNKTLFYLSWIFLTLLLAGYSLSKMPRGKLFGSQLGFMLLCMA